MWGGLQSSNFCQDSGDESLVTDITQELSVGLENPNVLAGSLFDQDVLKTGFAENCTDSTFSCDFINEFVKTEPDADFGIDDDEIQLIKTEQSSGHGSGSEASSLEQNWSVKSELDTPPTTPPDARVSPDNVQILPSNKVTFLPVAVTGINYSRSRSKPRLKTIAAKDTHLITELLTHNTLYPSNYIVINNEEESLHDAGPSLTKEELQKQQAKRRQERMIRNRESAFLSRKRKKEHFALLEKQVQDLSLENQKLRTENSELRERLKKYELWPSKQTWRNFPDLPRKTTALLALVVTVCINIGSLSGVLDSGQLTAQSIAVEPSSSNHHTRSLLWADPLDDGALSNLTTSCPVAINQSESMRLERELRRWIVGEKELVDLPQPSKKLKNDSFLSNRKKKLLRTRKAYQALPTTNTMNVFDLKSQLLGMESLYEAIHRRADTFYLVSFSADHLLLPAISRNQTSRPKMSVMLPAVLANSSLSGSERVEMMQIDCEVTNTQLLSVKEDDIPSHMRNTPKYSNESVKSVVTTHEDGFQSYPTPQQRETLYTVFNKMSNVPKEDRMKNKNTKMEAVEQLKNVTLPNLVSPYLNGTIFSKTGNKTLVTDSKMDETAGSFLQHFLPQQKTLVSPEMRDTKNRHNNHADNNYKEKNNNTTWPIKPLRNKNDNYLRSFYKG